MQQAKQPKVFAFKLADKQTTKQQKQVRQGVTEAGCSGPDARGSTRWGRDNGIWC